MKHIKFVISCYGILLHRDVPSKNGSTSIQMISDNEIWCDMYFVPSEHLTNQKHLPIENVTHTLLIIYCGRTIYILYVCMYVCTLDICYVHYWSFYVYSINFARHVNISKSMIIYTSKRHWMPMKFEHSEYVPWLNHNSRSIIVIWLSCFHMLSISVYSIVEFNAIRICAWKFNRFISFLHKMIKLLWDEWRVKTGKGLSQGYSEIPFSFWLLK